MRAGWTRSGDETVDGASGGGSAGVIESEKSTLDVRITLEDGKNLAEVIAFK